MGKVTIVQKSLAQKEIEEKQQEILALKMQNALLAKKIRKCNGNIVNTRGQINMKRRKK